MTTNGKWLGRTLLGGAALGVASAGAWADERTTLKAQIEFLQNRINRLETAPTPVARPDDANPIAFKRGRGTLSDWNVDRVGEDHMPEDSGFTVTVMPTANAPVPLAEVAVSGYAKGDVIYDVDQDLGDTFGAAENFGGKKERNVRLHARQSRFRVKSRSETAVGQIRTLLESDFYGGEGNILETRLRHAWGEWDMTPSWTFGAGRYWRIGCDVFTGVNLVDFGGSAGACGSTRTEQVRLTYTNGPLSFRFGISEPFREKPKVLHYRRALKGIPRIYWGRLPLMAETLSDRTTVGASDYPNFALALLYGDPGDSQLFVGGEVGHLKVNGAIPGGRRYKAEDIGWEFQVGTNINLTDVVTYTGHIQYGEGINNVNGDGNPAGRVGLRVDRRTRNITGYKFRPNRGWGGTAGLVFDLTDSALFNVQYGFAYGGCKACGSGYSSANTIHANLLWNPIRQLRLGWEGVYGWQQRDNATNPDAIRAQFAAWFYF